MFERCPMDGLVVLSYYMRLRVFHSETGRRFLFWADIRDGKSLRTQGRTNITIGRRSGVISLARSEWNLSIWSNFGRITHEAIVYIPCSSTIKIKNVVKRVQELQLLWLVDYHLRKAAILGLDSSNGIRALVRKTRDIGFMSPVQWKFPICL